MKILVIRSGEYSDQDWTPLVVPDDFDLDAARFGYLQHWLATADGKDATDATLSYVAYLCKHHGARDPEPSELVEDDDPAEYGSWYPSGWPREYRDAVRRPDPSVTSAQELAERLVEENLEQYLRALEANGYDLDDPLQQLVTERVNSAKPFASEDNARRVAKALRVNGRVGYPSSDLVDLFGLVPIEVDSKVYALPERVRIET